MKNAAKLLLVIASLAGAACSEEKAAENTETYPSITPNQIDEMVADAKRAESRPSAEGAQDSAK